MANDITIDIRAVNTASPEFVKVQKNLQDLTTTAQAVGRASAGMADSFRPVLAATRGMAVEIGSSLNPALGNMVGGLGLVARGAGAMGLALGAVTAGVVVAGATLGGYIETANRAAETQAKLNLAVRSFDLSAAKAGVAGFRLELDILDQKFQGTFGNQIRLLSVITNALGITTDAVKGLAAAQRAVEQIVPFERAFGLARERAIQIEAGRTGLAVGLGRAEQQGNLTDFEGIAAVMRARFMDQAAKVIEGIRHESARAVAEAQAQGQPAAEVSRLMELGFERVKTIGIQRDAARTGFEESVRRGRAGIIERRFPSGVSQGDPFGQVTPEEAMRIGEEASLGIRRGRAVNAAELASAEAQARTQLVGLTREARLELDLQAIAAAKTLAFAQAEGKLDQDQLKAMAELRATTTEQLARQAEFLQTNPAAGLAQGFRDVVDEFTAFGDLLRGGIRSIGSDMAQSMSDTFFNVVTGQFTKLSDVSRQFGLNVLKTLTDTLSKAAVGGIFQDLARGLGLGGSQGFVRGLGVLGGGLSAGGIVEVGGQLFQSVQAGGGQTVLVPLSAAGGSGGAAATMASAGGSGGGSAGGFLSLFSSTGDAIRAFLNTPLSSVAPSLFGASLAPSAATAAELQALGATGAEIAAATSGSGATIGTALGATAAVAALAFTIYTGLTGPPTAQNIASGFVSGAISGAIIGSYFPGYGTAIGAVAGGLLGGGAAAFGKEDPNVKKQRQQAEVNRAVGAAQALGGAVQATNSIEELFTLLAANGSGYTGGTSAVAIVSMVHPSGQPRVGPALFIGYPNPTYPVATVEEFARYGATSFVASIQAGVNPGFLSGPNVDLETAVRNKITQLNQLTSQIELSTSDLLASPFGGGVVRSTSFRASQAGAFAGQQLSIEGPSLLGLTPEQKAAFLRDLAKLDQDLNLNILFRDPATDEIVSLSSTVAPAFSGA